MGINLSNLIESVMNPNGRFRTLNGIYCQRGADGGPSMSVGELAVNFDTVWNGAGYAMKCFFTRDDERDRRLEEISLYTERIECRHLTPWLYLEKEMVVFDDADTPVYTDVVLQRKPAGERLDRYLHSLASSGGREAIRELLGGLSDMAEWLSANDFSHNNICAATICAAGSNPVLVDYSRASRTRSCGDLASVGALAAALYVTACQPELYDAVIRDKTLKPGRLPRLVRILTDIMEGSGADELNDLLAILAPGGSAGNGNAECGDTCVDSAGNVWPGSGGVESEDGGRICAAIRRLASAPVRGYAVLENIAENLLLKNDPPSPVRKYTFIGQMRDMVMRAFDGAKWFYIDRNGDMAFAGYFASAEDFCEGRAVVETDEGYGLIDSRGRFVIEPRYDDMEWDGANNVAIATSEGQSGLFSREGEPLTGLIYDQILPANESMFPVRKNGKYGFIRRDGVMAIKPRFDDAFGFRDGFARVSNANNQFLIDREGRVIDEIRQKSAGQESAGK